MRYSSEFDTGVLLPSGYNAFYTLREGLHDQLARAPILVEDASAPFRRELTPQIRTKSERKNALSTCITRTS